MTTPSKSIPSRNAPCACGSGKKFKHCCGAAPTAGETPAPTPARGRRNGKPWLLALGLLGFVAIAVYAMISVERSSREPPRANSVAAPFTFTPPAAGASTPEPWHYDAANNQHWDPAHGHWHQGPPAPQASRE